jgi:hypothetical protein
MSRVYPQLVNKHNVQYRPQQGPARSVLEGSRNCSCASGSAGAHIGLGLDASVVAPTMLDFRKAAGDPRDSQGNPRGLSSAEHETALAALGVPRDATAKRYYGESLSTAWQQLTTGYVLDVGGYYGYINNNLRQISGDRNFNGNHAAMLSDPIANDPAFGGNRSVLFSEGLQDGRPKSYPVPNGPQRIAWRHAKGFMERLRVGPAGATHAIGKGVGVWSAIRIAETSDQKRARLEGELDVQLAIAGDENSDMTTRQMALDNAKPLLDEIGALP